MVKKKSGAAKRKKSGAAKKSTAPYPKKKPSAKKKRSTKSKSGVPGYTPTRSGLLLPSSRTADKPGHVVAPAKIRSGIAKAKNELSKLLQEFSDLSDGYSVYELELAASFSADGKFLGIGVGGATTITLRFRPDDLPTS